MNDTSRDDIARLFRENDNIGPDSSVWLRPLRQLLKVGKPVGPFLALTVSMADDQRQPVGMLSQTGKDRLIFWPVLPPNVKIVCTGEPVDAFDHITLEFPSKRIHVTAYRANGEAVHTPRAWRTHRYGDSGLALWFLLLVRISVLRQQDMAVQRKIHVPASDKKRRTEEFVGLQHRLRLQNIPLPPHDAEQDYIYLGFYIAPISVATDKVSAPTLPADTSVDSQIEGWPDKSTFTVAGLRFRFGEQVICVAAACPPGRLLSDVSVGFAGRRNQ
jgi:hypothetical protein